MKMISFFLKDKKDEDRGFTFIELLVVFSIIGILSAVGFTSFATYGQSQALNSAANNIVTFINLARSRAESQVKPEDCVNNNLELESYEVRLCGINNNFCISGIKSPSFGYELDVWCGGSSYLVANYSSKLSNSLVFDSSTTTTSIVFPVLTGGVMGTGIIVIKGYGQTKTITVNTFGSTVQ